MGKFLKSTICVACLVILAIWSPWKEWNFAWFNLLGINSKDAYASLRVQSFSGELEVSVDDDKKGVTAGEGEVLEIFPIEPGNHMLKLKRIDSSNFYHEVIKEIPFTKEIDVIVGYELGPSEVFSEGYILYSKESFTANRNPILEIFSSTPEVNVKLNGIDVGLTPLLNLELTTETTHKLLFQKDGYDELEIQLLPEAREDRDKLKDHLLTLDVSLFVRPFILESATSSNERT